MATGRARTWTVKSLFSPRTWTVRVHDPSATSFSPQTISVRVPFMSPIMNGPGQSTGRFRNGRDCPQTVHRLGLSTIRPGERSVHAESENMTRASQFDCGSAAVASISCSPPHPAALQIDPPAASEFWPLCFAPVNLWRHPIREEKISRNHLAYEIDLRKPTFRELAPQPTLCRILAC